MAGGNTVTTGSSNRSGFVGGGVGGGRARKPKFSKKGLQSQRPLDPAMLLSRGLSARFLGANIPVLPSTGQPALTPLSKEEMEKDLRLMNAYYQANICYAQQHYIHMNRGVLGSTMAAEVSNNNNNNSVGGDAGATSDSAAAAATAAAMTSTSTTTPTPPMITPMVAMPVRIDPEEEKRLSNLRKKIAQCETQREILESQYVSLRAHYVATTKELAMASKHNDGLVLFLQTITARRAKVLGLQRARLQMARDVATCLQARLQKATATKTNNNNVTAAMDVDTDAMMNTATSSVATNNSTSNEEEKDDDILQVWADMEDLLAEAELDCRRVPSSLALPEKKRKKNKKKDGMLPLGKDNKKDGPTSSSVEESSKSGILPWDAIKLPNTPQGVPLYLSQLSLVPEKGAAYGTSGFFGAHSSSLCWMESNLPASYNAQEEEEKLAKLRREVQFLQDELHKERNDNLALQSNIVEKRKRSDELVSMMTLLRSETESILHRHNILLDSDIAKKAAKALHEEHVRTRGKGTSNKNNNDNDGDDDDDGANVVPEEDDDDDDENEKAAFDKEDDRRHDENENNDVDEDEDDDEDGGDTGTEEDDEEGEIVEEEGGEWDGTDSGGKRNLEEGELSSSLSPGGRKRRKL